MTKREFDQCDSEYSMLGPLTRRNVSFKIFEDNVLPKSWGDFATLRLLINRGFASFQLVPFFFDKWKEITGKEFNPNIDYDLHVKCRSWKCNSDKGYLCLYLECDRSNSTYDIDYPLFIDTSAYCLKCLHLTSHNKIALVYDELCYGRILRQNEDILTKQDSLCFLCSGELDNDCQYLSWNMFSRQVHNRYTRYSGTHICTKCLKTGYNNGTIEICKWFNENPKIREYKDEEDECNYDSESTVF